RHTRFSRDWSSDVCSSDLADVAVCDVRRNHPHIGISRDKRLDVRIRAKVTIGPTSQRVLLWFAQLELCHVLNVIWVVAGTNCGRSEERRVGKGCRGGWTPY